MDTRGQRINVVESYNLAAITDQDFSFSTNTEEVWKETATVFPEEEYFIFYFLQGRGIDSWGQVQINS